ncbi:MAG: GNAT family N-acetyltransferase, partial [Nocardioides sp.]|nr:GNAT family N-acetyltransferase [Nocardioides sp.]
MPVPVVRPARERDLAGLAAIEDSGVAVFEEALGDLSGSALVAPSPSGHERAADGFVLVAGDPPVGFAHVVFREGHAHLEQLSVLPEHGRSGIGTALLEAVCDRLSVLGHGQVTLTTYADLPWNAPFYARRGFEEVPADEPRTPHQAAVLAH